MNHPSINLNAIEKIADRTDKCYELAGKLVRDNPDWILVHTVVQTPIGKNGHAYLEKDGWIYDPVKNEFFNPEEKQKIMRIFPPQIIVYYTQSEAIQNMEQQKNWGPWSKETYCP